MEETANVGEAREKYSINKNGEPIIPFTSIANLEYIHSNQFANLVAATFRKAFADFEGCLFETTNEGRPYMSFYFNHAKTDANSTLPVACELVNVSNKGNDVISRMRQRDTLMKDGDRYYLTQDAMDIFAELVPDYYHNRNHKIEWKKYVSETADPTTGPNQYDRSFFGGKSHAQFTRVTAVDVNCLAKLIYGSKNAETGEVYDYEVLIKACLDNPAMNPNPYQYTRFHNYMLEVKQIPVHALEEVCRSVGIIQGSGLITGL